MTTIHQVMATANKDIGTCEKHMGQHKKQKDCKLWKSIALPRIPR